MLILSVYARVVLLGSAKKNVNADNMVTHDQTAADCIMQRTVLPRPFCPSVCLSVKRVHCNKTKETCANILIPRERSFIPVF